MARYWEAEDPSEAPFASTPFGKLPAELRLAIYKYALPPTGTRSLYIQRHIYAWHQRRLPISQKQTRRYIALLLVCKQMHDEFVDVLYKRHELALYTDGAPDLSPQAFVRYRLCEIEDYRNVLLRVQKLRLTVFITGDKHQDNTLLAILAYLKAVLGNRTQPLKSLAIVMCAMGVTAQTCKPTAIVYATQGFRKCGPTQFFFQSGFSGTGNEAAIEALLGRGNEKMVQRMTELTEEEALKRLVKAWKGGRLAWYNPKAVCDRFLKKQLGLYN